MGAKEKQQLDKSKYKKEAIIVGGMDSMVHAPRMILTNTTDGDTKTIVLPMPKGLVDNTSIEWDTANAGIAGQVEDLSSVESAFTSLKSILTNMGITDQTKKQVIGAAGAAIGGDKAMIKDLVAKKQGKVINPFQEQFFRGVGLRSFTFDWEIVPLAYEEQEALTRAIRALKRGSLPTKTQEIYLTYPEPWTVDFYENGRLTNPTDDHLPNIGMSHISVINVDYQGAGHTAYHEGNAPVQTNLSITLTEQEIVYGDTYDGD